MSTSKPRILDVLTSARALLAGPWEEYRPDGGYTDDVSASQKLVYAIGRAAYGDEMVSGDAGAAITAYLRPPSGQPARQDKPRDMDAVLDMLDHVIELLTQEVTP